MKIGETLSERISTQLRVEKGKKGQRTSLAMTVLAFCLCKNTVKAFVVPPIELNDDWNCTIL
jgi:hypothetical protein